MTAIKDAALSGTITYNGFAFGSSSATPPTYRLRGAPVYDRAGRTVTHIKYTLEVTTILYATSEQTLGQQMRQLRQQLSRPGRKLAILDIGLGDTTVQDGQSHPDVVWGAKPKVLALQPIGGALAWQLHWQCEFNVSESTSVKPTSGDWLALNYDTRYDIDELGFTTRTIRGYVQIAQIRGSAGDPVPSRTADQARDRVKIIVPLGFRRLRSRWTESADKAQLEFEVVDEELRSDPFPAGIVDADIDFEVDSQGLGGSRSSASLQGYLETAPGAPKWLAAIKMFMIAQDKMRRLQAGLGTLGPALVVPSRVSIRHKLFTRRTAFSIQFNVVHCLGNLLLATGIWDPVPGSDYRQWRSSVEHLWGSRGRSGLRPKLSDGAIIDLIDNPATDISISSSATLPRVDTSTFALAQLLPTITPATSWLDYRIRLRATRRENVSLHRLSQELSEAPLGGSSGTSLGAPFQATQGTIGCVREVHGEPIQQVHLEGVATRLGVLPTVPSLSSVGGRVARERKRSQELSQLSSYCDIPVYLLRWSITYDIAGHVRNLDPPANPLLGN